MPVVTHRSVSSLLRARDSGFRYSVEKDGQLKNSVTGLKCWLVTFFAGKQGRAGGLFEHAVKAYVGKESYSRMREQLGKNRDSSIRNAMTIFFRTCNDVC